MEAPMHRQENIFGKIRGRFDEKFAQQIMLTQADRALAAVMSMDAVQLACFIEKFNRVNVGKLQIRVLQP